MRLLHGNLLFLAVLLIVGCGRHTERPQAVAQEVTVMAENTPTCRQPCMAGSFYSGDGKRLASQVNGFIEAAAIPAIDDEIIALIAPHAGYTYSGGVAGYAYAAIRGRKYSTVIIIGPSHRGLPLTGAALTSHAYWETPMGRIPVNTELNERLLASSSRFIVSDAAHDAEHCLEVQLPFLQSVLDDFSIVPIVFRDFDAANVEPIARAIASIADEDTLIVASADLSHFPSAVDAQVVDNAILDAFCTLDEARVRSTDAQLMMAGKRNLACACCGLGPAVAAMTAAKLRGAHAAHKLKYANSADIDASTADRCVGYGVVAFSGKRIPWQADEADTAGSDDEEAELNEEQQSWLLELARRSIRWHLTGADEDAEPDSPGPWADVERAVFVTLRQDGRLRGCIGQIIAVSTLRDAVWQAAGDAALRDSRFRPVTIDELDGLHIDISVLSPMKPVSDYRDIIAGKHGVLVARGMRRGVFLPQVATEQCWDRDTMLRALCVEKAGLSSEAYKDPATELYVFTAQVFGESE